MNPSPRSADSERRHRDLAAPLHEQDFWSKLPDFFQFVVDESLKGDLRPGKCANPCKAEEDIAGTFLLAIVVAGAFPRVTVHTELTELTTSNFPIQRTWLAIDAYKPHRGQSGTRQPSKREQKLRFPLVHLCLALLYRLVRFYELHAKIETCPFPGSSGPHCIALTENDQPLFSCRIRNQRRFFLNWLNKAYRNYLKHRVPETAPIPDKEPTHSLPLSFKQLVYAVQIRRLEVLSPWIVSSLSQHWKSCPSEPVDVLRILFGLDIERGSSNERDRSLEGKDAPGRAQGPPLTVVECYTKFPPPLADAYSEVVKVLRSLHADMSGEERQAVRAQVRQTKEAFEAAVGHEPNGLLQNASYLLGWLEWLLSRSSLSPETALKYYKKLQVFIFHMFDDVPVIDIDDSDEFIEIVAECMDWYDDPESQRDVRISFQSFLNWMAQKKLIAKISLSDAALRVYRDSEERAIVSFTDVDKLLNRITELVNNGKLQPDEGARYRIFIILCFYLGLRSREAVRLMLGDLQVTNHETLLWVLRSKTRHGIRLLPVNILIPEPYLNELIVFYRRAKELAGPNHKVPLLPDGHGDFCRSAYYGRRIGRLMKKVLTFGSAHDLRHSFATWFLVRSDLLLHGRPEQLTSPEFDHPVFHQPAMSQFSYALFGKPLSNLPLGARELAHPVSRLSKLLGHACPEITLSVYAHSLDWIYYFIVLRQGDNPTLLGAPSHLGRNQAANFLLQSPQNQEKNGFTRTPTLRTIITLQQSQLGLSSDHIEALNNFFPRS